MNGKKYELREPFVLNAKKIGFYASRDNNAQLIVNLSKKKKSFFSVNILLYGIIGLALLAIIILVSRYFSFSNDEQLAAALAQKVENYKSQLDSLNEVFYTEITGLDTLIAKAETINTQAPKKQDTIPLFQYHQRIKIEENLFAVRNKKIEEGLDSLTVANQDDSKIINYLGNIKILVVKISETQRELINMIDELEHKIEIEEAEERAINAKLVKEFNYYKDMCTVV